MKKLLLVFCLGITAISLFGQDNPGEFRYFDEPIMIDTSATLLIPIRYNTRFMSKNKLGLQSYYANILVTTSDDTPPSKLFEKDTYILPLITGNHGFFYEKRGRFSRPSSKSISTKWVFYRVKTNDFDDNGKINGQDPTVLFVTDLSGHGLKQLTKDNENVVAQYVYEKQNLIVIKIQRDSHSNHKFTSKDDDHYLLFLDYATLAEIKRVDIE